jgi:lipoprotein-anchoring transpeptidase ErfK/SrfK
MRTFKTIPVFLTILVLAFSPLTAASAQETTTFPEPDSGAVVCAPGVYLDNPGDCLPLGPSQTITEMARQGFPYPPEPLFALQRDPALSQVPYLYYQVLDYSTNTYSSLNAAMNKSGAIRQIGPGDLIYLTYMDVQKTDHGTYIQLTSGEWMPGAGTRVSTPNLFQGIELASTPRIPFGWAIFGTDIYNIPSYAGQVVRNLPKHELVQIYQTTVVDENEWFMIGADEWVPTRQVAAVFPNTTPPEGVTAPRWIDVDLAEQTLAVYENGQMIFATVIASGLDPFWTRPGTFQIYQKKETENMSGAFEADRSDYYYLDKVPYTMYFDKARAIHGAYWRTSLGFPQSHGCVNMSIGDAAWLFNWAKEGDWVYVHDRTGETPSDPKFYGDGGA